MARISREDIVTVLKARDINFTDVKVHRFRHRVTITRGRKSETFDYRAQGEWTTGIQWIKLRRKGKHVPFGKLNQMLAD